jgi:hypothetical protein
MLVTKSIIISLILQDMRHNQLLRGLKKAKLNTDFHSLEIIDIVELLMEVTKEPENDNWVKTYISFMEEASKQSITDRGLEMLPLAEECYRLLIACQNIEQRVLE